ncbi:hypothetical protein M3Y99_01235600 [Aphelenchoides fujianensis]|nr:hypothetical protein M3Y99_01235600 [Aphelenchoides fujianensis]
MLWLLIAAPLLLTFAVTDVAACCGGCCGCGCCCTPCQTVNPPLLVKLPPVRPPCCPCCGCGGGGCGCCGCGCGCCGGRRKRLAERALRNCECKPQEVKPLRALRKCLQK